MISILTPHNPEYQLFIPEDPTSLIGWLIIFGILVFVTVIFHDRSFRLSRKNLTCLAGLSVLVLVFTPFMGLTFEPNSSSNLNDLPFMFFAATPWLVAGGVLGVVPAVLLAGISGLLLAYLSTHSLFTPLIFMSLGLTFSIFIRQRYRNFFYRLLRFPIVSGVVSILVTIPLIFIILVLQADGGMGARIALALTEFQNTFLALSGMVLIGSLICLFLKTFTPALWISKGKLVAAPGETSLRFRVFSILLPILTVFLAWFLLDQWLDVHSRAREAVIDKMRDTSQIVEDEISDFIQTGENLVVNLASDDWMLMSGSGEMGEFLKSQIKSQEFFTQLIILNETGLEVASYPKTSELNLGFLPFDHEKFEIALAGAQVQIFPILPENESGSPQICYLTPIRDETGSVEGVLTGLTALEDNTYFQTTALALSQFASDVGSAYVVAGEGAVLVKTDPEIPSTSVSGNAYPTRTFFEGLTPSGKPSLNVFQPIPGTDWGVVLSAPKERVLEAAWEQVRPLFVFGLGTVSFVLILLAISLRGITKDLRQLNEAAVNISQGNFDFELPKNRHLGEVGELSQSFQKMLAALRIRLQRQSDLLTVSERITGQLKLQDSLQVVLMAALDRGVSSVRILIEENSKNLSAKAASQQFGAGKFAEHYAALDDVILDLSYTHPPLVLEDVEIRTFIHIPVGLPYPGSLIVLPLTWKQRFLGVMWLTYEDRSEVSEEIFTYFKELAQKATIAVVNAKAFDESIAIRKQLEVVLNNLPDPVLITDEAGEVIYHNKAAQSFPGLEQGSEEKKSLNDIFQNEELLGIFKQAMYDPQSVEVEFDEGTTYQVMVSPVKVQDRQLGVVGIFKDITHFKKIDLLKSEFVTTVSHELRSPLTLIHGYAKILRLTGNVSEQQDAYIEHIIDGVVEMKNLVQNLLDLGRLEAGEALEITRTSASEIVKKVVDSLQVHARQNNIELKVADLEEPIYLEADVTFLTQALKNLVDNAIKFTSMGGEVEIEVRERDENVIFVVRDTGIGIAPLDQSRLFEKFHRASNIRPQTQKGSGLGLAIVKSIADRHDGRVWFESQLGKGSTFYLQIPRRI